MSLLPAGDLGVRSVLSELYCHGRKATQIEGRSLMSRWLNNKGLLAFHLIKLKAGRGPAGDPSSTASAEHWSEV